MTLVRWLFRLLVLAFVAVGVTAVVARCSDGPIGPFPGGPLEAGDLASGPVADWTFAAGVQEIELQLAAQDRSRTTWILVHEGKAYVPASTEYPPGKSWHRVALSDGRAILRIAGKRYPVTLAKVDDEAVVNSVREVGAHKYPQRPPGDAWLFAVTSRPAD